MKLTKIYISPESNYWKHKVGTPGSAPTHEPETVEVHEGRGLVGDRFYDFKNDYAGQVSFMSQDALDSMFDELGTNADYSVFRRNLIVAGIDPLSLIGKKFRVGEVEFEGCKDCTPCPWMDFAAGDGTFKWLSDNSKGGLRAKVTKSGHIKLGDELVII